MKLTNSRTWRLALVFILISFVDMAKGTPVKGLSINKIEIEHARHTVDIGNNARLPPNTIEQLDHLLLRVSSKTGPLALIVQRKGEPIYEKGFRGAGAQTLFPLASCSKWLIAATLLSLVEQGLIALDDPVGKYLPSFSREKAKVTLRQLLSHTSGLPPNLKENQTQSRTLAEAVDHLGHWVPLSEAPGRRFCYGNLSFQVAVRVAEVASGQPWHKVFDERIAKPCGMTETRFHLEGLDRGVNQARATIKDFARFLEMFKNDGVALNGHRVLAKESVVEMRKNQTNGLEMACVDRKQHLRMGRLEYGLGVWREQVNAVTGEPAALSHFGTSGFRGVIHYPEDYVMVLGINRKGGGQKRFLNERFMEAVSILHVLMP